MASLQSSHPLPPPPFGQQIQYEQQYHQPQHEQQQYRQQQQQYRQQQQQHQQAEQRPEARQRSKSNFSLRSDRSHKSGGSGGIGDTESAKEKSARRLSLTTKADPRLAMQEAEPSAVASAQPTSLAPLRAIQHLDAMGNPIADPDRSNPTRSRWERPLDTIRSFEAAIDGNYTRKSYAPADPGPGYNRRSIYYGGGMNGGAMGPRRPQDSYNAARPNSFRPDSYVENKVINHGMSRPGSYYDNNTRPSNGYYPSRARYPRTASEPQFNHGTGVYPAPGNQRSYETVTTASGSGSSGDPLGYSTDPSSENSSIDRVHPTVPEHGIGSFGHGKQNYQSPNHIMNGPGGYQGKQPEVLVMNGGFQGQPGIPPPHVQREVNPAPPRVPIKLTPQASATPANYQAPRPGPGEKRKSWLSRRFSRA